jgi:hypothetical protein
MARKRTNGRFTKSTRRRKSKPKLSISNTAQSILVASAFTNGVFATPLIPFFTEGWGKAVYNGTNTTSIALPDLFERLIPGGSSGMVNTRFPDITDSIKENMSHGGAMMVAQIIGIPILFKVAEKMLRKSVILPANRMLKSTGLDVKV